MTSALDRLEGQIVDFIEKAKQFKSQAQEIREQGLKMAQETEIEVRKTMRSYFEDGLKFVEKNLEKGKKATDKFVAETEKKSKELKSNSGSTSHQVAKKAHASSSRAQSAKATKSKSAGARKAKGKSHKAQAHHSATTH